MKYTIVYLCLVAFPLFFIGCSDDVIKKEEDKKVTGKFSPPEWICYYQWENENAKIWVAVKDLEFIPKTGKIAVPVYFQRIIEESLPTTKFEFFETLNTDEEFEGGMRMTPDNGEVKEYKYKFRKLSEVQIEYIKSDTETEILNRVSDNKIK